MKNTQPEPEPSTTPEDPEVQASSDLEDERGRGFFLLAQMVDGIDVEPSLDGKGLALEAHRTLDGRHAG